MKQIRHIVKENGTKLAPRLVLVMFHEAWKLLPGVMDRCDVPKVLLGGHSDGGSMDILLAHAFRDRVSGLISEAAHVYLDLLTM
ncbi:hypothetical protein [Desulfocicer niacini]